MCSVDYLGKVLTEPLLTIRFKQDADAVMVFCVDRDGEEKFSGLSLHYVRESTNMVKRTRPEIVTDVFQPRLASVPRKPGSWYLHLRPLERPIIIAKKGEGFVAQYKFAAHRCVGKVADVLVDAQKAPLKVAFAIRGTYRASKESAPQALTEATQAPQDFAQKLEAIYSSS
jgi:hypothetical protein